MKTVFINLENKEYKYIENLDDCNLSNNIACKLNFKNEDSYKLTQRISKINSYCVDYFEKNRLYGYDSFLIFGSCFTELPEYITKAFVVYKDKIISVGANILFYLHQLGISSLILIKKSNKKNLDNISFFIFEDCVEFIDSKDTLYEKSELLKDFLFMENSISGSYGFLNSGIFVYQQNLEPILTGKSGLGTIFYNFGIKAIGVSKKIKKDKMNNDYNINSYYQVEKFVNEASSNHSDYNINSYCCNCRIQCNQPTDGKNSEFQKNNDIKRFNKENIEIVDKIGLDYKTVESFCSSNNLNIVDFCNDFMKYKEYFNSFVINNNLYKEKKIDKYDEIGFCKFAGEKNYLKIIEELKKLGYYQLFATN